MTISEKVFSETKNGITKYYLRRRKFLGKTEDFTDKQEASREKKHLKAYLKGAIQYRHLYRTERGVRTPAYYPVLEGTQIVEITETEYKKHQDKISQPIKETVEA